MGLSCVECQQCRSRRMPRLHAWPARRGRGVALVLKRPTTGRRIRFPVNIPLARCPNGSLLGAEVARFVATPLISIGSKWDLWQVEPTLNPVEPQDPPCTPLRRSPTEPRTECPCNTIRAALVGVAKRLVADSLHRPEPSSVPMARLARCRRTWFAPERLQPSMMDSSLIHLNLLSFSSLLHMCSPHPRVSHDKCAPRRSARLLVAL